MIFVIPLNTTNGNRKKVKIEKKDLLSGIVFVVLSQGCDYGAVKYCLYSLHHVIIFSQKSIFKLFLLKPGVLRILFLYKQKI